MALQAGGEARAGLNPEPGTDQYVTESDNILGVALRFDTITVCIKNIIHTGVSIG